MNPPELPADDVGEGADRRETFPPRRDSGRRRDNTPTETQTRWRTYLACFMIGAGFYATLWFLYGWAT